METGKAGTQEGQEVEVSVPILEDPVVAPEMGVANEGGCELSVKAKDVEVPIPVPPPLEPIPAPMPMPMPERIPPPAMQAPTDDSFPTVEQDEITITDQDVLFGRGGLTNRHIGNLRYRDIISIHRQDYVRVQKTEKPNVARRIVKAIRTGKNPGRFLRKGDDGKWHQVSDKEAAWKASQALREKSRWSSMKQDEAPPSPATTGTLAAGVIAQNEAAIPNAKTRKKRKAAEAELQDEEFPEAKKVKAEILESPQPQPLVEAVPTEISHISVPPVSTLGVTKQVGANYILPSTITNPTDIFPHDEDVLFGRGGRTNHHPGNKRLRDIVQKYRDTYHQAKKVDKPKVSKLIVSALRSAIPPSRFLRMNEDTAQWEDVGDKRAAEKVSQTLREKDKSARSEYNAEYKSLKREPVSREEAAFAAAQAAAVAQGRTAPEEIAPAQVAVAARATSPASPDETKIAHVEDMKDVQVSMQSPEKLAPIPSPEKLTSIPSPEKLARIPSPDKLARIPSPEKLVPLLSPGHDQFEI